MTNSVERSDFFSAEDFDAALLCQERYFCVQAAPDGVYEIPLVPSDIADAADSDLPLPLPYRRLNADVLEYIEDAAGDLPKRSAARIVVYLPIGKIAPGLESRLNAYLGLYRRLRIDKVKRPQRCAEGASLGRRLHALLPDRSLFCGLSQPADRHKHDFRRAARLGLGRTLESLRPAPLCLEPGSAAPQTLGAHRVFPARSSTAHGHGRLAACRRNARIRPMKRLDEADSAAGPRCSNQCPANDSFETIYSRMGMGRRARLL